MQQVKYHSMMIDDIVWADILQHFDEAYRLISGVAENGGRILVHCPNPGFMYQLEMYHAMKHTVDLSLPAYRLFRIQLRARTKMGVMSYAQVDDQFNNSFLPARGVLATSYTGILTGAQSPPPPPTVIRCRKCRFVLHDGKTVPNVMWHDHSASGSSSSRCAFIHIEPKAWMHGIDEDDSESEGRIVCPMPRCGAKLGSWSWAGADCSCGTRVWPSFALHSSKVDEIKSA
ncbi:tyrosine protein phosphatase yvh1 [Geranomyces michiganensis]|nr:tyrosine protein phosphatase yvh1 [Geranomyces michiganensis]